MTDWQLITPHSSLLTPNYSFLTIQGLNLDTLWEDIVRQIGNINSSFLTPNSSLSALSEQIRADEERAKIERQIATLERQMKATKQPRRKRELFVELQKLKSHV